MLFLFLGCHTPDPTPSPDPAPDLTERLGPDAARAGVVIDPASLFGGISAEGALGDFKIYNDRVQFVVQAVGDSSYYVEYGGGLIDADLVREPGVPGRDIIDEMTPTAGLGRVVDATSVTIVSDGADGEAVLRVEGPAAPMRLLTGAVESPGAIPELDLRLRTDFTLAPGSWSLRATTTVWNDENDDVVLALGEVGILAMDVAEGWRPRTGRDEATDDTSDWIGAFAHQNEVALMIAGDSASGTIATLESGAVGRILSATAPAIVGSGPTETLAPGESASWTRWIGVGPDLATLSGEQLTRAGIGRDVSGTVSDVGGSPVPGARVHVLDADGAPLTVAVTNAEGAWSARVPDPAASYVASGRGQALIVDLPPGHGWVSPYESDPAATLATLAAGAPPIPFAEGYGVSAASAEPALTLTAPGVLRVTVTDGGPAVVRALFAEADPAVVDARLVPGRASGAGVIGFVRDGELELPLEPGTYSVVVYRGVRDELFTQTVTVVSGEIVAMAAELTVAYTLDGVVTGDPHTHASPSGDGGIPMADRLLVAAASGIDLHFGTDHDHVADYRPLLAPMGLATRLRSIVAVEVSPVLRGHFNAWPATRTPTEANGGAPRWWFGYADTAEIFGWMRALVGEDGIIQANHPVGSSGMFSFAEYDTVAGTLDAPDHWSDDFDAMELLNSGDRTENLPYYLDLLSRGHLVTPVGVSDSHSHTSGGVGLNQTFFQTGGTLAALDNDALLDAMARRATVVSHGPFIDARIAGEWAPGTTVIGPAALTVDVKAPSWMPVETVSLYANGAVIATEACLGAAPTPCSVTWDLTPEADAVYVVIAESFMSPMIGAHPGELAWAATSGTRLDVTGDGWTSPLPALVPAVAPGG